MTRRSHAFSLTELLIVVSALAILAAIVLPRYAETGEKARITAAEVQLETVRRALERYKLDHGQYPPIDQMWDALTQRTDAEGQIVPHGRFGPYITEPPTNPWTLVDDVEAPASAGNDDTGWAYDAAAGSIGAVGFDERLRKFRTVKFIEVRKLNGEFERVSDSSSSSSPDSELSSSGK